MICRMYKINHWGISKVSSRVSLFPQIPLHFCYFPECPSGFVSRPETCILIRCFHKYPWVLCCVRKRESCLAQLTKKKGASTATYISSFCPFIRTGGDLVTICPRSPTLFSTLSFNNTWIKIFIDSCPRVYVMITCTTHLWDLWEPNGLAKLMNVCGDEDINS